MNGVRLRLMVKGMIAKEKAQILSILRYPKCFERVVDASIAREAGRTAESRMMELVL